MHRPEWPGALPPHTFLATNKWLDRQTCLSQRAASIELGAAAISLCSSFSCTELQTNINEFDIM